MSEQNGQAARFVKEMRYRIGQHKSPEGWYCPQCKRNRRYDKLTGDKEPNSEQFCPKCGTSLGRGEVIKDAGQKQLEQALDLIESQTREIERLCSQRGACSRSCYHHQTHPCEDCGRINGYLPSVWKALTGQKDTLTAQLAAAKEEGTKWFNKACGLINECGAKDKKIERLRGFVEYVDEHVTDTCNDGYTLRNTTPQILKERATGVLQERKGGKMTDPRQRCRHCIYWARVSVRTGICDSPESPRHKQNLLDDDKCEKWKDRRKPQ